jgi:hypothetical protein
MATAMLVSAIIVIVLGRNMAARKVRYSS